MYMCAIGIDSHQFSVGIWSCFEGGIFLFVFHFNNCGGCLVMEDAAVSGEHNTSL